MKVQMTINTTQHTIKWTHIDKVPWRHIMVPQRVDTVPDKGSMKTFIKLDFLAIMHVRGRDAGN